jgi:N-acetylglucosaminyldiphosphoundecaprenol N-acetyl-beta-D-mannosaminyltransferase
LKVEKIDKSIEIFSVAITGTQIKQVLNKIWLQRKEMLHVATVNPEFIMEAKTNQKFAHVLGKCLTVADGHGVIWANKILQSQIINSQIEEKNQLERISGTQLVEDMLKHASLNDEKVFLLGAADGVAQKAAIEMSKKYPTLNVAWFSGAQTVKVEKDEEASMTIAKINGFEPDYLLVAYGSPWQDMWIEENRPYLRVRVAMGVGGALDEWAGVVKLCPDWIDKLGFKWVWRLATEPWRFGRIMRVLHFGLLVLYHKAID